MQEPAYAAKLRRGWKWIRPRRATAARAAGLARDLRHGAPLAPADELAAAGRAAGEAVALGELGGLLDPESPRAALQCAQHHPPGGGLV